MRTLLRSLMVTLIVLGAWAPPLPARAYPAAGQTYIVNSTLDEPDGDALDGECLSFPSLKCTLRAAVMASNSAAGPNTIILPAGTYLLTRRGQDDSAQLGDLDVTDDLTIQGAGSGNTIVDGNSAVTYDRVFQILSGAVDTSLSGLTLQAEHRLSSTLTLYDGGGLKWEGAPSGNLRLSDVVFQANSAQYGGGLILDYGQAASVDLENVVVRANTANIEGGMAVYMISGFGDFLMNNSQVYSNTATVSGGMALYGIKGPNAPIRIRIDHTDIYSNMATDYAGGINVEAGSAEHPLQIFNSHIHDNYAGYGGGLFIIDGAVVLSQTAVASNTATNQGGGVYLLSPPLLRSTSNRAR